MRHISKVAAVAAAAPLLLLGAQFAYAQTPGTGTNGTDTSGGLNSGMNGTTNTNTGNNNTNTGSSNTGTGATGTGSSGTGTSGTGTGGTGTTPGIPNTGMGAEAMTNLAVMIASLAALAAGMVYVRKYA